MGEMNKFIDNLMEKMTVREKVGQLNQCGNSIYNDDYKVGWDLLREGRIGSFLGISDVEKANEMQRVAVEETRLGIPLLLGFDVIHGFRTVFPVPWAETCSWEPELAYKTASASTLEAVANGVSWIYAPMIDVARDSRWGRIVEGSGEDTYLGGKFAKARVRGIQGKNIGDGTHAAACAKHFVAYGAAEAGRDYNSVDMSEQKLYEVYLPPFKEAIDAGCETVMTAFHDLNGEPCTGSHWLLTDVLKRGMHFNGVVISDAGSTDQIKTHGFASDYKEVAETAINAGLDVEMCFGIFTYQDYLEELVKEGKVSMETLDNAVRRVLILKYKLGLFDNPYKDVEKAKAVLRTKENIELAYEAAVKSIVLLKNESNVLPLKEGITLSMFGPFALSNDEMLGSWEALGRAEECVSPYEGIKRYANVILSNEKDCQNDIAIVFIGESRSLNGEGKSRTGNVIPGEQIELLRQVSGKFQKVITVVIGGRPLVLSEVCNLSDAVIFSGALGNEAGNAYADVIFGKYIPGGKLVNTFPTVVGQTPLYYNHNNTGKPPVEEFFWTSKYIDTPIEPLFPFGFGLSYTQFEYSNLCVKRNKISLGDKLEVSVDVKNVGEFSGDEIVQLYISDDVASRTRPVKELKAFKKLHIKSGECITVEFEVPSEALGFYNKKLEYIVESGSFTVMIGTNSRDVICGSFEIC